MTQHGPSGNMKYKFVEIGCSIWNTYADRFGLDVVGLLVEPMPNLFKVVPSSNTVKKENTAITDYNGTVDFHLYDEFSVDTEYSYYGNIKLSETTQQPKGWGASSIDLNPNPARKLNGKLTVSAMTLKTLFEKYNITEIDYFKIDAEGHDDNILNQLDKLLETKKIIVHKEIIFEYGYPICKKENLDNISNKILNREKFKKETIGADVRLYK